MPQPAGTEHESTEAFNEHRPLLFGIAYRMLGSVADAEDIVQEAYLRWRRADVATVESPRAYLSSIVTRLSIDYLRSARVKREVYVGQWLPEPLVSPKAEATRSLELAESLSTAFLVLLESLSPPERAAFLLRDVFDYEYRDIAACLDKSEANCRQMVKRARERVAGGKPRFEAAPEQYERLALRFMRAVNDGDVATLVESLTEDAALYTDHGGKAAAARRTITSADKVARFLVGVTERFSPDDARSVIQTINGRPGVVVYSRGRAVTAISFDVTDGRIANIYVVRNPDKLGRVPLP